MADGQGRIIDFPELTMAGASTGRFRAPLLEELIPLPEGSEIFVLPGRLPVGIEPASGEAVLLDHNPFAPQEAIQAVATFMAPAHTAVLGAAFQSREGAPLLPLFAYTAVGWLDGRFYVTAFRSDPDPRQDADQFNQARIRKKTLRRLSSMAANRLVQHLGKCCLTYGCPAARNYFLDRWEAPLPCSPSCNAACIGCISLQPSGCCPSTQDRIRFVPSPSELAEIAVPHLKTAPRAVVSFGQGCEGEPLLQAPTIAQAIRRMRAATERGTINLNTNASRPEAVAELAAIGLDSMRVSLNSARKPFHHAYYRSTSFDLDTVCASIDAMKQAGGFVSLNYFILPGFSDDPEEFEALSILIDRHCPDFIQLRNLNIDPEWYCRELGHRPAAAPMGMLHWRRALGERFPSLRFGYFNPPLR